MKITKLFLLSILLLTQSAFAGDPGDKIAKELNLTDAQKTQVKAIREKYQPQMKEKRQAARAARRELQELMRSDKKGAEIQASLQTKHKNVQTLQNAAQDIGFQMALEIREVLNPDQIAKFRGLFPGKGGHHRFGKHGKKGASNDDGDDDE